MTDKVNIEVELLEPEPAARLIMNFLYNDLVYQCLELFSEKEIEELKNGGEEAIKLRVDRLADECKPFLIKNITDALNDNIQSSKPVQVYYTTDNDGNSDFYFAQGFLSDEEMKNAVNNNEEIPNYDFVIQHEYWDIDLNPPNLEFKYTVVDENFPNAVKITTAR